MVLAFPPFPLWPLSFLAPAPLCWIAVRGARGRAESALTGAAFGATFFSGTVYWVVPVMWSYGGLPRWLAVLVFLPLLAYLAAFPTAFAALLYRARTRHGPVVALAIAPCLWTGLEILRNYALTGFPWARLGLALHDVPLLLQGAAVAGVYGLSLLLMLAAVTAAALAGAAPRRAALRFAAVAGVTLAVVAAWGWMRLAALDGEARDARPEQRLSVACVQGNVPQAEKWAPGQAESHLATHVRLSEEAYRDGAGLVVWPESSLPMALRSQARMEREVRDVARRAGRPLVVGSLDTRRAASGEQVVYNSAFLVSGDGSLADIYDKVHLVPFGEYVPAERWLWFVDSLVQEVGSLRAGSDGRPLATAALPGPLGVEICYEIVFPEMSRRAARLGAALLVNLTNDAWFGDTSAPHQHFAEAKLRAVESGRYLVRAANTGVSGIVAPTGVVLASAHLDVQAVVRGEVLWRGERTPYVVTGDLVAWACVTLAAVVLMLPRVPNAPRRTNPPA
jgi:apolipoprotein N-acyltransferase